MAGSRCRSYWTLESQMRRTRINIQHACVHQHSNQFGSNSFELIIALQHMLLESLKTNGYRATLNHTNVFMILEQSSLDLCLWTCYGTMESRTFQQLWQLQSANASIKQLVICSEPWRTRILQKDWSRLSTSSTLVWPAQLMLLTQQFITH